LKIHTTVIAIVCGLVALGFASSARAVNVIYTPIDTFTATISDLTGFLTTGADMAGMSVTADFQGGGSESVTWAATGVDSGAATGTGWSLNEVGDTFTGSWGLAVTNDAIGITKVTVAGFVSNGQATTGTVFDRTLPSFGTDGSAQGHDLTLNSAIGAWTDLQVVYRDLVDNLADGPGAVGDLYRQMELTFGQVVVATNGEILQPVPFLFGDTLSFVQDTDSVGVRLPEPSTFVLGAMSIVALGLTARRRFRRR
jgi:hypothetical protein